MRFQVQPQVLPNTLSMEWLISASGSYSVLASNLLKDIQNSDLEDMEMCRILNDRIMAVRPVISAFRLFGDIFTEICSLPLNTWRQ